MANEFNLKDFLSKYKPKKVDLKNYLSHPKLKGYHKSTPEELYPLKTYIKYVKNSDIVPDSMPDPSTIKTGGILMHGGYYKTVWTKNEYTKKFIPSIKKEKWTHLMLKLNIPNEDDEETQSRIYIISMSKNTVFHRQFSFDQVHDISVEFRKRQSRKSDDKN